MHNTGNDMGKFLIKPTLLEPPETSPNRSLTPLSLTISPAKVLPSPNRTTTTPALPRARAQLPNRRSPLLPTFLQNSGKTESYAPHHAPHVPSWGVVPQSQLTTLTLLMPLTLPLVHTPHPFSTSHSLPPYASICTVSIIHQHLSGSCDVGYNIIFSYRYVTWPS